MLLRLLRYPYGNAKARALAAQLLKTEEITELARAGSPAAVAGALERRKLAASGEAGFHQDFLEFGRKIARALPAAARDLIQAYLSRAGVENLKAICRALLQGRAEEARPLLLATVPADMFPPKAADARTLEELAASLPRGPYRAAVRAAGTVAPAQRLDFLEARLDRLFWERVRESSDRLGWFDRLAARETLGMRADVDRLRIVARGLHGTLPLAAVLAALPPLGTILPRRHVARLLEAGEGGALSLLLPPGAPGEAAGAGGEMFLFRRLRRHLRQMLLSPPFDISVPLSALLLKELEGHDLRAILGGLRVGAGREEIDPFLTFAGG